MPANNKMPPAPLIGKHLLARTVGRFSSSAAEKRMRRRVQRPAIVSSRRQLVSMFNPSSGFRRAPIRTPATSTFLGAPSQSHQQHNLSPAERAELLCLSSMLPPALRVANPSVDPIRVIENTTHYIAQLTAAIVARVQNGTLPADVLDELSPPLELLQESPSSASMDQSPVPSSASVETTSPAGFSPISAHVINGNTISRRKSLSVSPKGSTAIQGIKKPTITKKPRKK